MQFLKPGERSGKHRHMWEELIFVVEGSGYDLHWDMKFDCLDAFKWEWAEEPKQVRMEARRLHLHPAVHHPPAFRRREEARLIMMSNRIVKEMGFDWFDQVEKAPGFSSSAVNNKNDTFQGGMTCGLGRWAAASRPRSWRLRRSASARLPAMRRARRSSTRARNVELYIGYSVGGAYDLYARAARAPPRQAHSGQSDRSCRRTWRAPAACGSPTGSTMSAPRTAPCSASSAAAPAFDPLLGSKAAQFQADKFTWIGSANNEVSVCVAWKGSGITKFEDTLSEGADRRRHRRGGRHRSVPAHPQRRARHQVQDRHRLSGRQRHHAGDGARRGEGPLRLVVVERAWPRTSAGSTTRRSPCWCSCRSTSIPTCRTFRWSWISPRPTSRSRSSS